jgi:dienelactone hydrolase
MKRAQLSLLLLLAFAVTASLLVGCDSGGQPTPTTPAPPPPMATTASAPSPQPTSSAVSTPAPIPAVSQERIDAAKKAITQMSQGDFASVEAQFDQTMQTQLPADKLKQAWEQITGQAGAYKGQKAVTTTQQQSYDIVIVTAEFETGNINFRVVFDKDGKIAGFFAQPIAQSTPPAYVPPPYVDQSKFTEKDVKVGSGEWELSGTLSMPVGKGPFPAVVLVQGSGPQDRDETIGLNKPFRDLAWGLASQGVAVLRYDKRTLVYQQKMAAMQDKITVKEEVVDDAVAALDLLGRTDRVDPNKLVLLGHSLGGMLVPMIVGQLIMLDRAPPLTVGATSPPHVAGAIVMAGPTRPFEDVILDQYRYIFNLDGKITADEQKQLDDLAKQVARVKDPNLSPATPASDLPLNLPANYWLSIRDYHPEKVAAGQEEPMLIMQGERDYQVTLADFEGWKKALSSRSNVTFKTYPRVNHIFKEGEGMGTPDEYNAPGHMSEEVVKDIADWIKKQ